MLICRERGRDLRYLNTWSRFLLNLPSLVRLSIVLLSFLACLFLFVMAFPSQFNGSLFALPVALAAWLFKWRGAGLSIAATVLTLAIINSMAIGSIFWPQRVWNDFLVGIVALLAEGGIIGYLRHTLDLVQAAQLKTLEAEQQRTIAYEQRIEALQEKQRIALAYEQQQQVDRLKNQFILNVSHELRTPLTATSGYLELLLAQHGQLDSTTQANFLKNAMHGCEELQALVDNVLDALQIGEGREDPEEEELAVYAVAHEVIEAFDPIQRQQHTIQLDIPEHLIVQANAEYVRRVLRNLLSNACKYSPIDTLVIVSAAPSSDITSQVCISVQDAGPGIPPDELPLLFGQFVRLKRDLSGTVPGTGLGLYVCKQMVEAMGGRIWAESTGIPGQGSRFCFTLPSVSRTSITSEAADLHS